MNTTTRRWVCSCVACSYCHPKGAREREFHANINLVGGDRVEGAHCLGCRRRARLDLEAAIGPQPERKGS